MFSSVKETLDFYFPVRNSTMLLTYTDVTIDYSLMKTSSASAFNIFHVCFTFEGLLPIKIKIDPIH
jgi:hypothetical protein